MKYSHPVFLSLLLVLGVCETYAAVVRDWEHFQVIIERAPFGRGPTADELAALAAANTPPPPPPGPSLADTVKVTAMTKFGGTPAVGFTDIAAGGKSFYLFEGQTVGDYTLVSVDMAAASVVLRKGEQEETLQLPSVGASIASPTLAALSTPLSLPTARAGTQPAPPATNTDGQNLSYAERQRLRVEEARRKADEARRAAEENAQLQAIEQKVEDEAARRLQRERDLNLIRQGQSPSQNFVLTAEEAAKLKEEGFDLTAPAQ